MSATPRSPILGLAVAGAALAAIGGGAFLLLRTAPVEAPPPVVAPARPAAPPAGAPEAPPAPAPAPAPAGAESMAGRVLHGEKGEEAVEGATVEVYAGEGEPVPFLKPLAAGTTGADGKFRVGGLEKEKTYRVLASREGMASAQSGPVGVAEPVDLRLLPASFVAGTVKDAETKEPLPGARVSADNGVGTTAGPDGTFRLERVPAGLVTVTATAPGHAPAGRPVSTAKKGKEGLVLLLPPASSVEGVVLGPDGAPAPGADVTVRVYSTLPMVGRMATGTHEAKSGADGKFRVDGVEAGKELQASARNETGFAAPVDAGPLQRGKPAEGITLRIAPGAAVAVTVLDADGKPVEGASVSSEAAPEEGVDPKSRAARIAAAASGEDAGPGATTDAAGLARLRPVPPGKRTVTARKQDFLPAGEAVDAGAGAEAALTLRLAPGVAIEGKAADDLGAPVADADVSVSRFRAGDFVHESRKTGPDGSFRVGGLEGKGFQVAASKSGLVPAQQGGVDPSAGPLSLVLARGGAIAGIVTDEEGKPVSAFTASAEATARKGKRPAMPFLEGMEGTRFEDAAGKFRLEGLAPGTYGVTVKADDLAPGRVADVAVAAGGTVEVKVVLPAGLTLAGVVVRKGEETPVAGAAVSVAAPGPFGGMDVDFDLGEAGGEGGVEGLADVQEAMAGLGGSRSATTDAEGRFLLKGLEAGKVDLKVKAKEFAPATQKGVAVPAEGEVRILLSEGGAIEGTVTDALRAPRAGAMVMLQKLPFTMKMASTDARGHYRIAGLAPGKYLFYVMEDGAGGMLAGGGLNMKSESVAIEEGKTLQKDHRLGEGVKVTGKVTRGGKPVAGTMVMLLPGAGRKDLGSAMLGGSGFAMATTKEDGSYEIAGLSPGVYTAMVQSGEGGGPAPGDPVEIRPGATEVRRDIALPRNAVRGIVVDAEGKPVQGVQVHAVATGKSVARASDLGEALSNMGGQAITGEDGRFAMEEMNAGSFTLQARSPDRGTALAENVVPSEEGTEVRLVLARGVEVTVRVLDAEGKPVAGAGIYLSAPGGMDLSGTDMEMLDPDRTGTDGRAVVTAPPGTVHFEAVVRGHAPGTAVAEATAGAEVVITLARGASLEVLVTDAAGAPRAGVSILLLDASGKPYAARMTVEGMGELLSAPATGADGKYARSDLPAGTYTVRASSGERFADSPATLAAGETRTVTVRLP